MQDQMQPINLLDLFLQGGWYIMLPLTFLLGVALFITIERYLTLIAANKNIERFGDQLLQLLEKQNFEGAKTLCLQYDTPAARMIAKGLEKKDKNIEKISSAMEDIGKIEINQIEQPLALLATISGVAPMIGFLGTTIGMIMTFHQMSLGGVEIKSLSGGIMQAMVTTVGGLVVGIFAYSAYNFLISKITKTTYYLEHISLLFLENIEKK